VSVLGNSVKKATELVVCSWQRPSKESYRVLVVLGGDRVEKLLLLLKLLSSFGQGQVDRKEAKIYCEFVSVETRV